MPAPPGRKCMNTSVSLSHAPTNQRLLCQVSIRELREGFLWRLGKLQLQAESRCRLARFLRVGTARFGQTEFFENRRRHDIYKSAITVPLGTRKRKKSKIMPSPSVKFTLRGPRAGDFRSGQQHQLHKKQHHIRRWKFAKMPRRVVRMRHLYLAENHSDSWGFSGVWKKWSCFLWSSCLSQKLASAYFFCNQPWRR